MDNRNMFSNVLIAAVIVALAVSIVAFSKSRQKTSNTREDSLTKIQQTKIMKVCYAVWPPAVIKDAKTGELSGHDIDAMRLMAEALNAKPEFHETTFGNMPAAVQSGICDIGTSLFVKLPRAASVAFSNPILFAGNSGLVRKGDTRFKTVEDVNKSGIKVAVATGESGHIYAQANLKNATIIPIDVESSDLSRFLLEVTSGRADIGIADANQIRLFAQAHPETEDVFAGKPFDLNPDAFPMRHGDTDFLNFVNNSLLYMQTSGKWAELEASYGANWIHEAKEYRLK